MTSSSETIALPTVPKTLRVVTACVWPATAPTFADPMQYPVIVTAAIVIATISRPRDRPSNRAPQPTRTAPNTSCIDEGEKYPEVRPPCAARHYRFGVVGDDRLLPDL